MRKRKASISKMPKKKRPKKRSTKKRTLSKRALLARNHIKVSTVDAFQGAEREIIILSTTRTSFSSGSKSSAKDVDSNHLRSPHRLNVALRNRDKRALEPFLPYVKLLLSALYQLPLVHVRTYRGVKLELFEVKDKRYLQRWETFPL